jgi:hypothetical protein
VADGEPLADELVDGFLVVEVVADGDVGARVGEVVALVRDVVADGGTDGVADGETDEAGADPEGSSDAGPDGCGAVLLEDVVARGTYTGLWVAVVDSGRTRK